jgi:hypothetical protein
MGPLSAGAVTEKSVDVPYERGNSEEPVGMTPVVTRPTESALGASQEPANGHASIPGGTNEACQAARRLTMAARTDYSTPTTRLAPGRRPARTRV